ncbi:MAG: class IV adenylate cyclase [Planctomycetales bacterium]
MFEVELKFPLTDPEAVLARLEAAGARRGEPFEQQDRYFAHPCRDFAQTNEAFRLRRSGDENRVTYKGPVVDTRTKTRREIEVPFAAGAATAGRLGELLAALGFREAGTVTKRRTPYQVDWEGRSLEVVHDEVDGLGRFLEIELIAEDAGRSAAQEAILRFADQLGLANPERRSYLELLIRGADSGPHESGD